MIARYVKSHLLALGEGINDLFTKPIACFLTIIVIAIALAFPTSLFILLYNVKSLSHNLTTTTTQIALYLQKNLTSEQLQNQIKKLQDNPAIASIQYISPEQGLKEFIKQTDFGDALAKLNENPLPGVIIVKPARSLQTPQEVAKLLQDLKQLTTVEMAQLDMTWVERLFAIITLSNYILYAFILLLGIDVLLTIGNSVNLALQKYAQKIELLKLLGASYGFIRRPFLYTGMLYGFLGSVFAWLQVMLLLKWLDNPIKHLATLYDSKFSLQGLTTEQSIILFAIGTILGLIAARLAVRGHLRKAF